MKPSVQKPLEIGASRLMENVPLASCGGVNGLIKTECHKCALPSKWNLRAWHALHQRCQPESCTREMALQSAARQQDHAVFRYSLPN